MKFIKFWGLMMMASLLMLTSCEEESLTPFDDYKNGVLPVPGAPVPNFFDLVQLDESSSTFSLDTRGQLAVNAINLLVSQNGGTAVPLKTVTSFPSDVTVSATEIMDALGITNEDVNLGDYFTIGMEMDTPEGTLKPNTSVTIDVSCPSSLAGEYEVTTVYAQHDFLPDFATHTMDVTITEVASGIYSVPDISGGLYSVGPYVDAYGTTPLEGQFKDVCTDISWTIQDTWQNLLPVDGSPSSVDGNGVITITMSGDVYGETWTSVYTPK